MATSPYTMEPATLTAAAVPYVTSPQSQYLTTKKVVATNTSTSAVTLTAYKVPNGGTASAGNLILEGLTIPPNTVNGGAKELYELENQILYAGDSLQFLASSAGVLNLNVSGITQTT